MEHASEKKFPVSSKDYKLYEEVGQGVSATVYRALCIPFNEIVAVKVLDLEKCNNDLDVIRREVKTMSLIDHPNLQRSQCSFTTGHHLWIVMPYMAGGSCFHIMKSAYPEGFEEPVIATLSREASNILVDVNGAVKLADFGVSTCMFDTGDRQRPRNTFVGTPCWMAHEVMQQLHGYDFKADIWSFGITALELAHGHAPFSKYPPMKVLLMISQNAPPGLDYERDEIFKDMVRLCLVKDPKEHPAAEKLFKHRFFKHAWSNEYLARTIHSGLPALGERFKMLKAKQADFLVKNKVIYRDNGEQLSQQEYVRGISGWNFNLEDLRTQADLIPDNDIISSLEVQDTNRKLKCQNDHIDFASKILSPERVDGSDIVTAEELLQDSLASFPIHSRRALSKSAFKERESLQQQYQNERNYSGPLLYFRRRDVNNHTSVTEDTLDKTLEGTIVQRKGRFKVTSEDVSSKGGSSVNSLTTPLHEGSNSSFILVTPVLPTLRCILHQNTMQREQIRKLIKLIQQASGHMTPLSDTDATNISQFSQDPTRERDLQFQVLHPQQSIDGIIEELKVLKMQNSQLEEKLNALTRNVGYAKIARDTNVSL